MGHRPPAWTGHGDVRHAVRPPQVGHRERDVPDTEARDPYRSGHNFGHGHNHLADVLPTLAMLAFLIDQVQRHCCPLFGRARRRQGRNLYLWNRLRELVRTFAFPDWRTPCRAIAGQLGREDYVGLIRAGRWPPDHARTTPIPPFADTPFSDTGQPPGHWPCASGTSGRRDTAEPAVSGPTDRLAGTAARHLSRVELQLHSR